MNKLAIVIPAYKRDYFDQALASIANQTCKNFTVYVGDDNSPHEIHEVVKKFDRQIKITYKRFNENLGGTDLAAQWNRCLDMAEGEEWLWLFSDDDIMEPNCVELFYNFIDTNSEASLLHFNVQIIDGNGRIKTELAPFPDRLSSANFFRGRINGDISSFAVEYIFKRDLYLKNGKFERFDLAWNSDDATWIKFAFENEIHTIRGGKILWRYSNSNISADTWNKQTIERKVRASIEYLIWVEEIFTRRSITQDVSDFQKVKTKILTFLGFSSLDLRDKFGLAVAALEKLNLRKLKFLTYLYLIYIQLKKNIIN